MGKEIELSTAITDIAAGPFGSNLKVQVASLSLMERT